MIIIYKDDFSIYYLKLFVNKKIQQGKCEIGSPITH